MITLLRALLYGGLFVALLSLASGQLLAWLGGAPRANGLAQMVGIAVTLLGSALALDCVLLFALLGHGTPLPFDPPRRLVTGGPYRLVRNPMAIGVGVALLGVALFYESVAVLVAVSLFMLVIHLMVTVYEEPTLRRTFGADYEAYCENVSRWLPRWPSASSGQAHGD